MSTIKKRREDKRQKTIGKNHARADSCEDFENKRSTYKGVDSEDLGSSTQSIGCQA